MLEINFTWFFVQAVNFLVLIVLLNYILFRPLLRLFKERDVQINGSLDGAKAMEKEKEAFFQEIKTKLSGARNEAKAVFENSRSEGLALQKKSIDEASKEAAEINKKARDDLGAEAERVRKSLRQEVETFSNEIVEKMVGV